MRWSEVPGSAAWSALCRAPSWACSPCTLMACLSERAARRACARACTQRRCRPGAAAWPLTAAPPPFLQAPHGSKQLAHAIAARWARATITRACAAARRRTSRGFQPGRGERRTLGDGHIVRGQRGRGVPRAHGLHHRQAQLVRGGLALLLPLGLPACAPQGRVRALACRRRPRVTCARSAVAQTGRPAACGRERAGRCCTLRQGKPSACKAVPAADFPRLLPAL